jgi:hypothetical protein
MHLMRLSVSVCLPVTAIVLVGCGTSAGKHDAGDVAARFVAAVSARDGAAACGLLTEQARESVSGATEASCAEAVLNVDEHSSPVHKVEVWGDAAQVRIGTDVVFLVHLRTGWRVIAAGCKPQPAAPYKCDVDG